MRHHVKPITINAKPLDLSLRCDQCGRWRNRGNHTACSKARQAARIAREGATQ